MKKQLASFLSRVLPRELLEALKRVYYFILLVSVRESREEDFVIIKKLVSRGACVLDIGANVGIYAKLLSRLVGPDGIVVSVEPVPGTFQILKSNVGKLQLRNVRLFNLAISDFCGRVNIAVPCSTHGVQNIYEARIAKEKIADSESFEVDAKTLDELARGISRKVDFVKCDVEGHELSVLRGASEFIREHHPSWFIEICGDPDISGSFAHQTFQLMEQYGYKVFLFNGKNLKPREKGGRCINYFFLCSDVVNRLKSDGVIL